jgi:hypothetical protein
MHDISSNSEFYFFLFETVCGNNKRVAGGSAYCVYDGRLEEVQERLLQGRSAT